MTLVVKHRFGRSPRRNAGLLLGCVLLLAAGCESREATYLDPLDMAVHPLPDGGRGNPGLPCDVSKVLTENCLSCHATAQGPSKLALATYGDLVAPARTNPAKKVIEESVLRMQDPARPMPSSGLLPAADVKVLQDWISAGLPKGSCGPDLVDGGVSDGASAVICTSGQTRTDGTTGKSNMYPGRACIACHATKSGPPKFQIAGTVYPTLHEPDNCHGSSGGTMPIVVEITGADGTVFPLTTNSVGNFTYRSSSTTIKLPYTAIVKQGTKTRAMKGSQMSGDCNGCHTQDGTNYAPGRIMAP